MTPVADPGEGPLIFSEKVYFLFTARIIFAEFKINS